MLVLRRSACSIRSQSYRAGVARICVATVDQSAFDSENGGGIKERSRFTSESNFALPAVFHGFSSASLHISLSGCRSLSSQAGAKSSDAENDPCDRLSEMEESVESTEAVEKEQDDNGLASEKEYDLGDDTTEAFDGDEESDVGLGVESDVAKATSKKTTSSGLFDALKSATRNNVHSELDKYVGEGNSIERIDVAVAMLKLRKRRKFQKALQLSEWIESNTCYDYQERDYASRLDLIAKVHGVHKAEKYMEKIPISFRTEVIYRTLLANCVAVNNVKKSEAIFNKMRDIGLPLTVFACNQLLILYKKVDRKKIADVLLMMEKGNIKPNVVTYRLLIDTKGRVNDIEGMEHIVETMKTEGIEINKDIQATLAKYYIHRGLTEKADNLLKEIEGDNIIADRWCCKLIIPLYAASGKVDDLERIWDICKENPHAAESLAAIEAWGKVGKVEKAEGVFEYVLNQWKNLSPNYYNALLRVYANHKLLAKGKELVKRMANNGCYAGPATWDPLVRLYLAAGELEKADFVLHKAVEQRQVKPWYGTYAVLLDKFAKRGDIHNAEKIFHQMRKFGFTGTLRAYQALIEAYIVAKTPAYGFRERMKADNIFPNNTLAGMLRTIDTFKKNHISELLL